MLGGIKYFRNTQNKEYGIIPVIGVFIALIALAVSGVGYIVYKDASIQKEIEVHKAVGERTILTETTPTQPLLPAQERANSIPQQTERAQISSLSKRLAVIPSEYAGNIRPTFSPDGSRVAYHVGNYILDPTQGGFVFEGDSKGPVYDYVSPPIFSPDGKRLAYIAGKNKNEFVVLDGKEQRKYPISDIPSSYPNVISGIVFSPDSSQYAYRVTRPNTNGTGQFIVHDGAEGKEYQTVSFPVFSDDGSKFGYRANTKDETFIVVNGEELMRHRPALGGRADGDFIFRPNGKHLTYIIHNPAEAGKSYLLVQDGVISQKKYRYISSMKFSPDSKRFAFAAALTNNGSMGGYMVVDGQEGESFSGGVGIPVFSPDSKRVAYVAWLYEQGKPQQTMIVSDGRKSRIYEGSVYNPVFSPDSNRLMYVFLKTAQEPPNGYEGFVVVDGKEGAKFNTLSSNPIFSHDNKHIAFAASATAGSLKMVMVTDNKSGKGYDWVGNPLFSADNRYVSYGAKDGNELWWITEEVNR